MQPGPLPQVAKYARCVQQVAQAHACVQQRCGDQHADADCNCSHGVSIPACCVSRLFIVASHGGGRGCTAQHSQKERAVRRDDESPSVPDHRTRTAHANYASSARRVRRNRCHILVVLEVRHEKMNSLPWPARPCVTPVAAARKLECPGYFMCQMQIPGGDTSLKTMKLGTIHLGHLPGCTLHNSWILLACRGPACSDAHLLPAARARACGPGTIVA